MALKPRPAAAAKSSGCIAPVTAKWGVMWMILFIAWTCLGSGWIRMSHDMAHHEKLSMAHPALTQ
jgi:hypothetical protein